MTHEDFMKLAILAAANCQPKDRKTTPRVGAVITIGDEPIAIASRGEHDHAEKIAIDSAKELNFDLTQAVVYTTLEPCVAAVRRGTLESCADRLVAARVRKVVVGIHDPNRDVTGKGFLRLQEAGIETELFPNALAQKIKGLNDEFIRAQQSLGIVIDKSIAQNEIKLTEENVLHIEGKWINPPDNPDIVRVIVQHNNIWWPQPKYPTPVGASREDWTSEITIGATGLHKIIIGNVNPLGKVLFDYYWRVIKANKQNLEKSKN